MNIQQLNYIVALDDHRHYGDAAAACFVSQPTLSMMVKKLEEELELVLFERRTSPVVPTREGKEIIAQCRKVLHEVDQLKEKARGAGSRLSGELRLGVIPTIAPYLVPLFIDQFIREHPSLKLNISEVTTEQVISGINKGELDAGILSTPLKDRSLMEIPLFYEEFFLYSSDPINSDYLVPEKLNLDKLWILEEGHCFRTQVLKMCELKKKSKNKFTYHTGNIESLISLVDKHGGFTIVPELSAKNLNRSRKKNLVSFSAPSPAREVSIVVRGTHYKKKLVEELKQFVINAVPKYMQISEDYNVMDAQLE